MTILSKVSKFVKQKLDDAFHKMHGQALAKVDPNDPDKVSEKFLKDLALAKQNPSNSYLARIEEQKAMALAYQDGRGAIGKPYPNLAQIQDDKRAEHNAHEAVRYACLWATGEAEVRPAGYEEDPLSQAQRALELHMHHTEKTGRLCANFAQGEEHVYVALMDLHDVMVNGEARAQQRVRVSIPRKEWAKAKIDYAKYDAQATNEWHDVLDERRTKLRAAVTAYISLKPPAQLPEAVVNEAS